MAETGMNIFDEASKLLREDMCKVYREWYPISKTVTDSRSLEYKVILQAGMMIYESRDITHFIVPTNKLYDLIQPMEYEHKVCVYDPNQVALQVLKHGREIECTGFVIALQSKHYGFDYEAYMKGKGRLVLIEKQMVEWSDKLTEEEWVNLQNLSMFLQSSIRKELGLPQDDDIAPVTTNSGVH